METENPAPCSQELPTFSKGYSSCPHILFNETANFVGQDPS
jgi:hypothetical protein